MDIKLSIVVLAYNIEEYIGKCLDTIVNQTYANIEIIVVDDGSTDKTGFICDEYKRTDERILVIHQENSGVNASRKKAVMMSTGDYIGFVDGDDWIEPDMYERMISRVLESGADIVTASGFRNYHWGQPEDQRLGDTVSPGIYDIRDNNFFILRRILTNDGRERINGAVWSKIFKSEIIKRVLSSTERNLSGEMDDNIIVLGAALLSKRIHVTHDMLYHHRERCESYTNSQNPFVLEQVNHAYLEMKRMIISAKLYEELYTDLCKDIIDRVDGVIFKLVDNKYLMEVKKWREEIREVAPLFFWNIKDNDMVYEKNIIIYGYGKVGKSYKKQFDAIRDINVVAVADKNCVDDNIIRPDEILRYTFDYILIAILSEKDAHEIRQELISIGIEPNKILWKKPLLTDEFYR